MKQALTKYRVKLINLVSLEHIDQHQSFQFVKRKYDILPSQIVAALLLLAVLLCMVLDGAGLISSLFNFVFPLYSLYLQISKHRQSKAVLKSRSEEQNSRLTDQQFSQVLSNKFFSRSQILEVYLIYFMFYIISQILSPFMEYTMGMIAWLILRCMLTIVMTKTKQRVTVASKIIQYSQSHVSAEELSGRRKMQVSLRV